MAKKTSFFKKRKPEKNAAKNSTVKEESFSSFSDFLVILESQFVLTALLVSAALYIGMISFDYAMIEDIDEHRDWPPSLVLQPENDKTVSGHVQNTDRMESSDARQTTHNPTLTNGGWRDVTQADWAKFGTRSCDFDWRSATDLTKEEFERRYRYKKPVIIYFPNGADGWTNSTLWTLPSLLSAYGEWEVGSGRGVDIVFNEGNGHYMSSFKTYISRFMDERNQQEEPLYLFDRKFYNESEIPKSMHPPDYLKISPVYDGNIFFLGASRSGVSFHKHADAWNGVVFGFKRWFLYPPTQTPPSGVLPGLGMVEWFTQIYPQLKQAQRPFECMQGPGEIFYIPESWYHGTINLGDTIAVGIQKDFGANHMENLTYQVTRIEDDKTLENREKIAKILPLWKELHETYPTNTEFMNRLGESFAAQGKFDEAIAVTRKAVEIDPFFLVAHLNLGKMFFAKGEIRLAEKHFLRAAQINPSHPSVCLNLGEFFIMTGRVDEGIKWFRLGAKEHSDKREFFEKLILKAENE